MLKGIDPLLDGDLLAALDRAGHGDRVLIADRNFPAHSSGVPVFRIASDDIVAVTRAVLSVTPVDDFVEYAVSCMVPDDPEPRELNGRQREVVGAIEQA